MVKKVVLVGGCFDVLHPGHIIFLKKARAAGDKLIVLLESDEKIRKLKGERRPFFNQKQRAQVLSAIKYVDQVIMLPFLETEMQYDQIIKKIKPDIIAVTEGKNVDYHKRAAKLIGAKLSYVTKIVGNYSTTNILTKN